MALNLRTFATRTITAAVFVAVLLACICFNYVSFTGLFFVVSIWGLYEFYKLAEKLGAKPYKVIGYMTGACMFFYCILANSILGLCYPVEKLAPFIFVFIFFVFIVALFDQDQNTIMNISFTIAGLVYAIIPFMILVNISCIDKTFTFNHPTGNYYNDMAPYNYHYVLGIILLIWASDVCAYLVGSLIGKNKLYERISPGKTWEGSIGATILTIGCSFIIAHWFPELALKHWIVISVLVCIFGTVGDLVESMLKRQANVKDSGKIMPGHGGILDRFDSLIFVSPFVYAYLTFIH
ncbi:MAG: phosphatidate cytidylyltransferase [Burkholderiales bacterium]|nr:phosphatidate cytidylyltransferase [Bacteroidia bacterium]